MVAETAVAREAAEGGGGDGGGRVAGTVARGWRRWRGDGGETAAGTAVVWRRRGSGGNCRTAHADECADGAHYNGSATATALTSALVAAVQRVLGDKEVFRHHEQERLKARAAAREHK